METKAIDEDNDNFGHIIFENTLSVVIIRFHWVVNENDTTIKLEGDKWNVINMISK